MNVGIFGDIFRRTAKHNLNTSFETPLILFVVTQFLTGIYVCNLNYQTLLALSQTCYLNFDSYI